MLPLSVSSGSCSRRYNLVSATGATSGVPVADLGALAGIHPRLRHRATRDLHHLGPRGLAPLPALRGPSVEIERLDPAAALRLSPAAPGLVAAGGVLAVAPVVWPSSLSSGLAGPYLALDPLLERLGLASLSSEIAARNRRRVWSLLLGGLVCGLLWEFWNFWAAWKWVYSVPFFGSWKMFEMPVLGFLGFPPFAWSAGSCTIYSRPS